jgi:hypothetical protein
MYPALRQCWCCLKSERETGPLTAAGSCLLCAAWLLTLSRNRPAA